MRPDDHAQPGDRDVADFRVGGPDLVADELGVGPAVGVQDVDFGARGVNLRQVVQHAVADCFQRRLAPARLLHDVERPLVGHVEHWLYAEHRAHERRRVRHAPAGLQVVQVVHGEAVRDLQLVGLAPFDDLVEAHPRFHAAHHVRHERAQAARDAAGVHDVQAPVGELRADRFGGAYGVAVRSRHLLRHVEEDDVFARSQEPPEELRVRILGDH